MLDASRRWRHARRSMPSISLRRAGLAILMALPAVSSAGDVTGAGSTFAFPIVARWAASYHAKTGERVHYQAIGSGGGIAQIKAGAVAFGASDKPLPPDELGKAGLLQFPLVVGGVVPVVNLDVVKSGQLKLAGPVLADIYLGKVTKWNDSAIAALNPELTLPDEPIVVVHRSDSSGTTFNWANYLSKSSEAWKSSVGEGTTVRWPLGIGGSGSEGVANNVGYRRGSIGYMELSYAIKRKMKVALVRNKAGVFADPSAESFQAAAASAEWKAADFYEVITDAPGKDAWPIAATTFVLMQRQPRDPVASAGALAFFKWALESGQADARKLDYVPLPTSLVPQIVEYWSKSDK